MAQIFLQLNEDKTEILVIGAKAPREKVVTQLKSLSQKNIKPQAKNLGVIFDNKLNFDTNIMNVTKAAFYHLKNIATVRPFFSQADTERLMHAFISIRLDYCNSLLSGLPKKTIGR